MSASDIVLIVILCGVGWLLLDVPLLKPWFGIRRPRGHRGHWFE